MPEEKRDSGQALAKRRTGAAPRRPAATPTWSSVESLLKQESHRKVQLLRAVARHGRRSSGRPALAVKRTGAFDRHGMPFENGPANNLDIAYIRFWTKST